MRRSAAGAVALAVLLLGSAASCSDDDGGDDATELCALVGDGRGYAPLFEGGFDPTDRDRALAQLRAATVDLGELRGAAPSSLHAAIDDEVRYLDALVEVIEASDPDDPAAVVDAVNGLDEEREAAEVAGLELATFQAEHCGARGATTSAPPPSGT